MAEPNIKFLGKVINGRMLFDRPKLFQNILDSLEEQEFELTIKKRSRHKTRLQLAYYWGGIISGTCMKCEEFAGWTKEEIDEYFRTTLRSYTKSILYTDRKTKQVKEEIRRVTERVSEYDKEQLALYIEDVVRHLALNFGITVLDPEEYKYAKYISVQDQTDKGKEEEEYF